MTSPALIYSAIETVLLAAAEVNITSAPSVKAAAAPSPVQLVPPSVHALSPLVPFHTSVEEISEEVSIILPVQLPDESVSKSTVMPLPEYEMLPAPSVSPSARVMVPPSITV